MKIERLDITAYGCLLDRSFPDLPGGLVLIHGRNEDGKSTVFSILSTLLYGFGSPSNFPYRPWHEDKYPEFSAELTLGDKSHAEVWRKLSSSPQGRLAYNGRTEKLSNNPLPFVQHVGKPLYEALYALTQGNLRLLDEDRRREIGDRLLSGLGAQILRPTREVIAEIEKEAQKLWRPDKRGKPQCGELRSQLRDVQARRKAALEKDDSLRKRARRLSEVQIDVERLEEELVELNTKLHMADVLLPVKARMDQINAWESEIPALDVLATLPDGLRGEHDRLSERVADRKNAAEQLREEKQEQLELQDRFTDEDRGIVEHEEEIDRWVRHFSAHEQERKNIALLEDEVALLKGSVESAAQQILTEPWRSEFQSEIAKIPFAELKARVDDCVGNREDVKRQEIAIQAVAPIAKTAELPSWLTLGAIALGLTLSVALLFVYRMGAVLGGTIVLLGAAGLLFNSLIRRQAMQQESQRAAEIERLRQIQQKAERSQEKAQRKIREILRSLPIAQALLERPSAMLCQLIEELRKLADEEHRRNQQLEARRDNWNDEHEELQDLMDTVSGHGLASSEAIHHLDNQLQVAKDHQSSFDRASERVRKIDSAELEDAEEKLEAAEGDLEAFLALVARAIGKDLEPEQALDKAAELQAVLRKVRTVREQLETEHPDLVKLEEQIRRLEKEAENDWLLDQEEVEKLRMRRDGLLSSDGELTSFREERTRLQTEIKNSRSDVSVGELDGEIEDIKERIDDVCRQRDRLVLLSSVLQRADRRFREQHQPDVLKRASEYLKVITGGRYTGIVALEDGTQEHLVVITGEGDDLPLEFPLSGGTLDQIHLAFRLAAIDHLDEAFERLPLMLDEVLINWDEHRIQTGLEILSSLAKKRQVFLFTCHDWIASYIEDVTEVSRINLIEQ